MDTTFDNAFSSIRKACFSGKKIDVDFVADIDSAHEFAGNGEKTSYLKITQCFDSIKERNKYRKIFLRLPGGLETDAPDGKIHVRGAASLSMSKNGEIQMIVDRENVEFLDEPSSKNRLVAAWKQQYEEFRTSRNKREFPEKCGNPLRILVVSPEGAKGLGDFRTKLRRSIEKKDILCDEIRPAQGETFPDCVRRIVQNTEKGRYDFICIVRGGGDPDDLLAFSEPTLVEAIMDSQTPCIIGIGHADDEVLCAAAATVSGGKNAITPTAAANILNGIVYGRKKEDLEKKLAEETLRANQYYQNWKTACQEAECAKKSFLELAEKTQKNDVSALLKKEKRRADRNGGLAFFFFVLFLASSALCLFWTDNIRRLLGI